jgi:hypothetical protein
MYFWFSSRISRLRGSKPLGLRQYFFRLAFFQFIFHFRKAWLTEIPAFLVEDAFLQDALELAKGAFAKDGVDGR